MRRAFLVILLFAAIAGAVGGAGWYWLKRSEAAAAERLDARLAYWNSELATAIPVGADRETVERWLAEKTGGEPADAWDREAHAYAATAEEVKAGGVGYPCKTWGIEVRVTLSDDGHVLRREAVSSGSCV